MRDRLTELGDTTDVVLITFSDPEKLATYRARNDLSFPILTDRDRVAYRAFGLGRGSIARIWGWRAGRRYVEILRADGLSALRRPEEDTLQLGGDFVVGPDGILEFGFWGEGPDDRPSVDDLIAEVRRIQR